ncbi:MAG: hypothetical protein A2V89_04755 [Gammaproteobacteria bacterium RBG_16_37_9]|nr:MAG: hypothetical protein A2V89_04755 [Gammaproteobacteria bacterium RBG_16_37_9]
MNFKKSFLSIIISIILMMLQAPCDANPKGTVNILTWYGYLRSPEIASIVKNKCGVKIYYDKYYNTVECIQRVSKIGVGNIYHYDIAIIPSDIYEYSKERIRVKKSNLNKIISRYDSNIKNHYLLRGYPNNVVYFMLSLSGFVWNPTVVKLKSNDDISSLFEKAKNNTVIIMDSPVAVRDLIDNNRRLPYTALVQAFDKVTKKTDIYITNGYSKLYDKDEFALAFQRSGTAVSAIRASKNKHLRFFVHPKYSYITPDLMAELNARPETQCVAKVLASKEVLDIVQKSTHYLSPYGTHKSTNDPVFLDVYKSLFDDIHKMRWLDSIPANDINVLEDTWIKIQLLPQIMKNRSF